MDLNTILIITLFLFGLIIAYFIGYKSGAFKKHREWELQIPEHRKDAVLKSRAVLGGQFSEQLAPYLPNFNFKPTEVRFLGKPVDFIAFRGLDEKNVEEIVFVEVKSGKSQLNKTEKSLKEAIKKKKVRFEEYRVDERVTKKREVEG